MNRGAGVLVGLVVLAGAACGGSESAVDAAGASDTGASETGASDVGPLLDAPVLGDGGASGTLVRAAAGGVVRSEDGLFEIWIGPGGIAADTTISITRLDAADVPAALAALTPISAVYALEPDGLTFTANGAFAHVILPTLPAGIVDPGPPAQYSVLEGSSVPDAGGMVEHFAAAQTSYFDATAADVVYPLRHLSVHTVTTQGTATVSVDFGSSTQFVGEPWQTRTHFVADDDGSSVLADTGRLEEFVLSAGVVVGHPTVIDMIGGPTGPSDRLLGHNLPAYLSTASHNDSDLANYVQVAHEASLGPGDPIGALGATREVSPPASLEPRFVCTAIGDTEIYVGARVYWMDTSPFGGRAPHELSVQVFASQLVDCVARPVIEARCDGQRVCRRLDDQLVCSATPSVACEVTARPTTTTTERIGSTPWFVTLSPASDPPSAGPATITATSGGATMTATRTATGTYDTVVASPTAWDPLAPVVWTATGEMPQSLDPPETVAVSYPDPLLDSLRVNAHTRFSGGVHRHAVQAAIRWAQNFDCHGTSVQGLTVFGSPDVVTLPGGDSGYDAPIRDAIDHVASHCGIPASTLESAPFYFDVQTTQTTRELPMTRVRVRTGETTRVDGGALVATCPGTQTYCTDRCVNTVTDRMNCGGCELTPLEVCDAADNDCDGLVDEHCPGYVFMYSGNNQVSPHFGDTTTPAGSYNTPTCNNALIGLCGSTNPDGSIRQLRAVCGTTTLRRITTTTPYSFVIDVAEFPTVGQCETGTTGGGHTGGTTQWAIRCPSGMVADGIEGQETGNIEQLQLHCSTWTVAQDTTGLWLIRRGTRGMSPIGGSGSGTPFGPWMIPDEPVDMQPGVLRTLSDRYFPVIMSQSDVIDLFVTGRSAELR